MERMDQECYSCTLVAVFSAALKLGLSPDALADNAKKELEVFSKIHSIQLRKIEGVIDESLRIARVLHPYH